MGVEDVMESKIITIISASVYLILSKVSHEKNWDTAKVLPRVSLDGIKIPENVNKGNT